MSSVTLGCLVGLDMRTFGIMLLLGSVLSFLPALVRPGLGMGVSLRDALQHDLYCCALPSLVQGF